MWDLSTFHAQSMERINAAFFDSGDGQAAVAARAQTVDDIVRGYVERLVPAEQSEGLAALAVGGYGRSQLFPHSDIDLLLLVRSETEAAARKAAGPSTTSNRILRKGRAVYATCNWPVGFRRSPTRAPIASPPARSIFRRIFANR